MPSNSPDLVHFEEQLRASLARALHVEPLLVTEEMLLHGPYEAVTGEKFQAKAVALLRAEPTIAEAERKALLPLDPETWTEASSIIESHFDSEPSIPERDLAVYRPTDQEIEELAEDESFDQMDQIARLALAAGAREIGQAQVEDELVEELPAEPEIDFSQEFEAPSTEDLIEEPVSDELAEFQLLESGVEAVEWDLAAAMDPSRLTPLPLVAAALEAVGLDEEQFGFLLRYGTFAPAGRTSEIKIAGLGMAEFSSRAADWFEAMGASKFPVQVVDDGSGNLTVYLLDAVPT